MTPGEARALPAERVAAAPAAQPAVRARLVAGRVPGGHLLFGLLLAAGAAVRAWALVGYAGALRLPPSAGYLHDAHTLTPSTGRPLGYGLFLAGLLGDHAWAVALVQHLLGLAMAGLLYAVLLRRRVPVWGAALATAPVLLDGWQVGVEQFVLSDTLFLFLAVAALTLLLWWRTPGTAVVVGVGLLLAAAALTRGAGALLFVPAAITVLALGSGGRRVVALLAAFAASIACYAFSYHEVHGAYATTQISGRMLYGRLAPIVDCTGLTLPAYERPLCPVQPVGERPSSLAYRTDPASPAFHVHPPPGMTSNAVLRDFAGRAVVHQPFAYLRAVGLDTLRELGPARAQGVDAPVPVTGFLASYAGWAVTPGPLLAVLLAVGLAAIAGLGRAARSGLRGATFAFAGVGVTAVLTASAFAGFASRYQLPLLVTLPPAAALAVTALVRRPAADAAAVLCYGWLPAPVQRLVAAGQGRRMGRYAVGSVVCTLISMVAFLGLFGLGVLGSRASSLAASAIGSLAGYWLNRNWTFGARGAGSLRRDWLPYWSTVVVTAVSAALVTGAVNAGIAHITTHHGVRAVGDALAYLATYGFFFVAKYAVFRRLFTRRSG